MAVRVTPFADLKRSIAGSDCFPSNLSDGALFVMGATGLATLSKVLPTDFAWLRIVDAMLGSGTLGANGSCSIRKG